MSNLNTLRHSASHILAQAVLQLFPNAKLGIGPAIENGFYYDFDLDSTLTESDLEKIEAKMNKIIGEGLEITKEVLSKQEAIAKLEKTNQTYKIELVNELDDNEELSFYSQGEFSDLCRGPHIANTKDLKAFKLLKVSGAYWRGKESNPMLQRIYGTAFPNSKELRLHLQQLAEAEKRDHRKLGKELDLYSIQEDTGPGLVFWHPNGARIRHLLETYWKDVHYENGYEMLYTPHIGQSNLWETSGHLEFYEENMFSPMNIDNNKYFIRPMNCPFHIQIYKSKLRSYRELPLRWAELGTVYRYERSGVLHGLLRVRGFTQDDGHIICTPDQIESEIHEIIKFASQMWKTLGFADLKFYISTKPKKSVGDPERWKTAENALKNALELEGITDYEIDEGGGAFYGPKIDIKVRDALNREWQTSTIQFDFNLPERFDMSFIGTDGKKHRPYMVHRALLGSIERFFGILIEHYAGKFPLWLSPKHFRILTITANDYSKEVFEKLKAAGFRGELDDRNEKLGAKIREARHALIPYMIIIGDKEVETNQIGVRKRGEKHTSSMNFESFQILLKKEIDSKV